MNKRGQTMDFEELIKLIILAPILLIILGSLVGVLSQIGKDNCPTCEDCTPYKNQITNLSLNLSDCLNRTTEIVYVNQTIEVPVETIVEKPLYKDSVPSITIISISLLLSIFLTIKLFRIEVKLPKEIEDKLKHYDKWIIRIKWISLGLSILILVKLIMILWSLF